MNYLNLYFINTGRLNMVYRKGNHGILLKSLGPGDIAGEPPLAEAMLLFTVGSCDANGDPLLRPAHLEPPRVVLSRGQPRLRSEKLDHACAHPAPLEPCG